MTVNFHINTKYSFSTNKKIVFYCTNCTNNRISTTILFLVYIVQSNFFSSNRKSTCPVITSLWC